MVELIDTARFPRQRSSQQRQPCCYIGQTCVCSQQVDFGLCMGVAGFVRERVRVGDYFGIDYVRVYKQVGRRPQPYKKE